MSLGHPSYPRPKGTRNHITLAPKKLIRAQRASEGSASEPSLAHRVSMCKDAKLSCRGNSMAEKRGYVEIGETGPRKTRVAWSKLDRLNPNPDRGLGGAWGQTEFQVNLKLGLTLRRELAQEARERCVGLSAISSLLQKGDSRVMSLGHPSYPRPKGTRNQTLTT